jgi:hypothetical protein
MRLRFAAPVLAIAGLLAAGCGGVIDPSKNAVDPFSGTLTPGGTFQTYKVNVGNNGEFSLKVTALTPTPTAIVGLELDFGANCESIVQRNTFATLNVTAISGLIQQKGNYCIVVFESIALAAPLNFTVSFSHP